MKFIRFLKGVAGFFVLLWLGFQMVGLLIAACLRGDFRCHRKSEEKGSRF